MDEGATDGVTNNPKSIIRPYASSNDRSNNKRTSDPRPYMDGLNTSRIYLSFINDRPSEMISSVFH